MDSLDRSASQLFDQDDEQRSSDPIVSLTTQRARTSSTGDSSNDEPAYSVDEDKKKVLASVSQVLQNVSIEVEERRRELVSSVSSAMNRASNDLEQLQSEELSSRITEQQERVSNAISGVIEKGTSTVKQAEKAVLDIAEDTNKAALQIVADAQVAVNAVTKTVNDVVALGNEKGPVGKMIKDLRKAGGVAYNACVGSMDQMSNEEQIRAQHYGLTVIAFATIAVGVVATVLHHRN